MATAFVDTTIRLASASDNRWVTFITHYSVIEGALMKLVTATVTVVPAFGSPARVRNLTHDQAKRLYPQVCGRRERRMYWANLRQM